MGGADSKHEREVGGADFSIYTTIMVMGELKTSAVFECEVWAVLNKLLFQVNTLFCLMLSIFFLHDIKNM